jgi:NADP-dependent 3-hydroxy acid dehydrogenase YdfG
MTTHHAALITGASRGLGLALAWQLASLGWTLILDARGNEALEATRLELSELTEVITVGGDVTDVVQRRAGRRRAHGRQPGCRRE